MHFGADKHFRVRPVDDTLAARWCIVLHQKGKDGQPVAAGQYLLLTSTSDIKSHNSFAYLSFSLMCHS